ncbi:hypothetical protein U4E84_14090, partial [Halorubrum sp. AD140]|nr:hypothetical protein [Halorubrum sp. AD140]
MRDTLEALDAGEIGVAEAESRLAGYATTAAGRFDAAREDRRGIPEAILADGKTPDEVAALATTAVETTGRALVTRADPDDTAAIRTAMADADLGTGGNADLGTEGDADSAAAPTIDHDERTDTVVVRAATFEPPALDATVAVVAAGTADAAVAGEAAVVAREVGATVDRVDDVGVAN